MPYGRDYPDPFDDEPVEDEPRDDEPISVVAFPTLPDAALQGLPGKVVQAVAGHTEAHPAAILVQFLARFGAVVGAGPHVRIDNREHAARLYPLIVGRTADGAKGTSAGVVSALFAAVDHQQRPRTAVGFLTSVEDEPLRVLSGMSSGEGLIELVRDPSKHDPSAKEFDCGVEDKRLLIVESEFAGTLSVMDRQGSTLARVIREAWDGDTLRTLTRSPLQATGAHIVVVGHVTPGEFRIKLKEAQLLGGTINRMLPVASRRTRLLPEGGNVPQSVLEEFASPIDDAIRAARQLKEVERSPAAMQAWADSYPYLRRSRPDGPVASVLARAAPQVLRLALAQALADGSDVIGEEHLAAAIAVWKYVEATADWMFGATVNNGEIDELVTFIADGGKAGRTSSELHTFYKRNKPKKEIDGLLAPLIRDGRVQQRKEGGGPGRPTVRYIAC